MAQSIVIGIAGGTASGKSTLAEKLFDKSGEFSTVILKLDDYYLDRPDLPFEERTKLNYDHPNAFDVDLLVSHLIALKTGHTIKKPVYDFVQHRRSDTTVLVHPAPVIILEGIMIFAIEKILNQIDFKIFVDTPADVRLLRRIKRDIEKRGRDLDSVSKQYLSTVRPMHDLFVEPSKVYADIIVPEGGYNKNATDLLLSKIESLVKESKNEMHKD
ncbi:MAG: uridine kinase [Firmicutes bacterium]|nr:uridine kinase [Bacillota bacterium]